MWIKKLKNTKKNLIKRVKKFLKKFPPFITYFKTFESSLVMCIDQWRSVDGKRIES
jgi:hypothetical protein